MHTIAASHQYACVDEDARYVVSLLIRYMVQSLPLLLLGGVGLALVSTRALQLVQSKVFHVIAFGQLSKFNIGDACMGILVSGSFMLYLGASCTNKSTDAELAACAAQPH